MQMKKYYIAYGSNLNVRQMKFRCPTARIVGT
ncbi:MAG: gamma-glutamylcyclotransferase, partial [Anaerotignum sp.]